MINLLKLLDGEWAGTGLGGYPTIESFEYLETLSFKLDGMTTLNRGCLTPSFNQS